MPRERQSPFLSSIFSFQFVNNYLTVSAFLFFSGFQYYYKIIQSFSNSLNVVDISNGTVISEDLKHQNIFENLYSAILKYRLLLYILLNTCCALITFAGKLLIEGLFDALTSQEENLLKKSFRQFIQSKLMFLIFISHHNLLEDIFIWTPWLAIYVVCLFLLELSNSRMSNPFIIVSNQYIRRRLYIANLITVFLSIMMSSFVFCIRSHFNINYILFLVADCCILFVQSIHLMLKLFIIVDSNSHRGQSSSNSSYYVDLVYDLVHDSVEFINYLHMILFSQLAMAYCCVFLIVQSKHYYTRISTKIQKHWQHQEIIQHISTCYEKATDEDLIKNTSCTICWQIMKCARKLPCGHVFHELCLRRWLEQDSSCAVCRQPLSLNLNSILRGGEIIGDDMDNALQYVVETFSPHNNRFARWWTRFFFETMNSDQVDAMVGRVSEMFPNRSREEIVNVIRDTGSINGAVDYFLSRTEEIENTTSNNDNVIANNNINFDSDSSSNTLNGSLLSETSDFEGETSNNLNTDSALLDQQSAPVLKMDNFVLFKNSNPYFVERAKSMIEANRKKYFQSSRADDIRHLENFQF